MDTLFSMPGDEEVNDLIEVLWLTPGWPKDPVRDREFIEELMRQFSNVDLTTEFAAFRVWLSKQGEEQERMVTSRGRFQRLRNWCRFVVESRGTGGVRPRGRRARQAPGRPDDFGDSGPAPGWR